ncbi:hypothetical protein MMC10_001294 [Thelotrema lepadinum]|nr:hypothetical protein [Thelotrema lepadinum]
MDEDDEMPKLSGSALAALQDFYAEKDTQEKRFAAMKAAITKNDKLSMDMFSEDWNASQFWVPLQGLVGYRSVI